jgi:diguanylate cyclase (GGDEF)-like protein
MPDQAAAGRMPRSRGALFVLTLSGSILVGWGLIIFAVSQVSLSGWPRPSETFVMIALLVILAELRPIVASRMAADPVYLSHAFVFATLYIWGWLPAILLMAAATLISEIVERKPLWKVIFNIGQYVISVAAAAVVLSAGIGLPGLRAEPEQLNAQWMPWIVLSWVAFHLVNLALVAGLNEEGGWWASFTEEFWFYTSSTMAVLALSPLVAVVAVADAKYSWALLPLLMLPLMAVQRTAQMSQEREHRALHDPLTGLPNRLLLTDRIETALARSSRSGGRVVVVFLDLDLFKTINDGLGHAVGDAVLVDVAERLTSVLRPGDTLARFSGDEFAIVCESIPDYEIEMLSARIQASLEPAFTFGSHEVTVTASIGVATATPHSTAESLLREADSAMYRAKSAGRDQVAHFHWSMHEAATARLDDQLGLRRALERGELRAHYQPIMDLTSGSVLGMEALVRWQHPDRGLIPPDQFIPLAEETGLILPIGAWVLDHSMRQLREWREEFPGAAELWMAVNISPRQLSDPDLTHKIARSLRDTGLAASSLHLEITETAIMNSLDRSTATLEALRSLGVQLIIDDFGTGYSSLARLKRLPVTALKIDRTFVDGLGMDSSDLSIVDAIANLARSLNLDVIAEGVETREQLEILHTLGANMGQGYLWSRALPADEIAGWVGEPLLTDLARFRAFVGRRAGEAREARA